MCVYLSLSLYIYIYIQIYIYIYIYKKAFVNATTATEPSPKNGRPPVSATRCEYQNMIYDVYVPLTRAIICQVTGLFPKSSFTVSEGVRHKSHL